MRYNQVIIQDIEKHLCINDQRSPHYDQIQNPRKTKKCYCEFCYRGKSELAEYALELKQQIKDLRSQIQTIHSMADLREFKEAMKV